MAGWVADKQGSSVSLRGREWGSRLGLLCFGPYRRECMGKDPDGAATEGEKRAW
jgi:hypothetical protein